MKRLVLLIMITIGVSLYSQEIDELLLCDTIWESDGGGIRLSFDEGKARLELLEANASFRVGTVLHYAYASLNDRQGKYLLLGDDLDMTNGAQWFGIAFFDNRRAMTTIRFYYLPTRSQDNVWFWCELFRRG